MALDRTALDRTFRATRNHLLAERVAAGHWVGALSPSALSTATAVCALALADRARQEKGPGPFVTNYSAFIRGGLDWLAANRNEDGGWGDTTLSKSNLSTTVLVWAAFAAAPGEPVGEEGRAVADAEAWLRRHIGDLDPERVAAAVIARYGKDRTFSAPILSMAALAGRLGPAPNSWQHVAQLPFELAALPHRWLKWLRLPVVSYALPALIAIGQARHHFLPSISPVARLARNAVADKTLEVLKGIQPPSGGFLEATPLTSFVTMNLIGAGHVDHPAVAKGLGFLAASVQPDGSWPIDTNLATWVTTLSVEALAAAPDFSAALAADERRKILDWLLGQQHLAEHPYTHAPPGAWAWTDLAGGVPDADDTAGAMLALRHLVSAENMSEGRGTAGLPSRGERGQPSATAGQASRATRPSNPLRAEDAPSDLAGRCRKAAARGVAWLLDLQNRDGGIPTFCRGWGTLPFDRSSPDLTAHAIRAWLAWLDDLAPALRQRVETAIARAAGYLEHTQRPDGAWVPLWFGNQWSPHDENPLYGTARVLPALQDLAARGHGPAAQMAARGAQWLLAAQDWAGAWGGSPGAKPSVEETALAVNALACVLQQKRGGSPDPPRSAAWGRGGSGDPPRETLEALPAESLRSAVSRGTEWLVRKTDEGQEFPPSPIGFYFAALWYYERLYPLIFTAAALGRVKGIDGL
jgi:squalene-hopene/tetraprenyl-beta-curcumene cyclase